VNSLIASGNRAFALSRLTRAVMLSLRKMQRENSVYVALALRCGVAGGLRITRVHGVLFQRRAAQPFRPPNVLIVESPLVIHLMSENGLRYGNSIVRLLALQSFVDHG
jgi:hypothetical protein